MWKNDCWSSKRFVGKKKWNRVINASRESAIFLFPWGQSVRVSDSSAIRICCETQLNTQTQSLKCARSRQDSNFWQRDNYDVFAASRIFAQTIFFQAKLLYRQQNCIGKFSIRKLICYPGFTWHRWQLWKHLFDEMLSLSVFKGTLTHWLP